MQKTRHLMDKNGAYFQMLIILLTFIEIGCGLRYNESEKLQRLVVCIVRPHFFYFMVYGSADVVF